MDQLNEEQGLRDSLF